MHETTRHGPGARWVPRHGRHRMEKFQVGDTARILDAPQKEKHLINEVVKVISVGGNGLAGDAVGVRLEDGTMLILKEHQLKRIPKCT